MNFDKKSLSEEDIKWRCTKNSTDSLDTIFKSI